MKKILFFFLVSLVSSGYNLPSRETNSVISWSKDYKLTWSDFKGTPDTDSHGDAATAIRIEAKPYYKGRKLFYDVNTLFIPEKSWYRHQSDEQLHFDLAELYARKARKKIAELQLAKVRDVKYYNKAIQEILNESNEADIEYDRETLHGSLPKAQSRWKFKVELELVLLEEYAKS
jgi:hypothetical protein